MGGRFQHNQGGGYYQRGGEYSSFHPPAKYFQQPFNKQKNDAWEEKINNCAVYQPKARFFIMKSADHESVRIS